VKAFKFKLEYEGAYKYEHFIVVLAENWPSALRCLAKEMEDREREPSLLPSCKADFEIEVEGWCVGEVDNYGEEKG
jgi:hypothetical protein